MKPNSTHELERREARIEDRLSRESWPENDGPVLSGCNEHLEVSERVSATPAGGIALIHRLVRQIGLAGLIDRSLSLLKIHLPYHESDHVLNLAYNVLCGGKTLDDIEFLRQDESYMDALGALRIPDPTTAGDFLRRFKRYDIDKLMEAINTARQRVWGKQPRSFFKCAIIDIDGTIAGTEGECKEGMDMSYKGIWGYAPLLVTLANTSEVIYTRNRPGSRPSHDDAFEYLYPAVEVVREAGFKKVLMRGDGHFALTDDFDFWTKKKVQFVFGLANNPKLVEIADRIEDADWRQLARDRRPRPDKPRAKMRRYKDEIIKERAYKHFTLEDETYTEFEYKPGKCERNYRVVAVKKVIRVEKGEQLLFPEIRYFFYITNAPKREMTARRVVRHANERCNQENLIEQMKNGVHAMRMPCDTFLANDAYMVIASLAWNLKAWVALLWPDQQEGEEIRRMEFRRFVGSFITIPCQVVRSGRRVVHRFLAFSRWLNSILLAHAVFKRLRFA